MKKKGFTLVELLAVIVILAIIALIATPMILNVIDNAKKGAFKSSVLGLLESAELYKVRHIESVNTSNEMVFTCTSTGCVTIDGNELSFKGEIPKSGTITINGNDIIVTEITDGKYCATGAKENLAITKDCNKPDIDAPELTLGSTSAKINDAIIYYNITDISGVSVSDITCKAGTSSGSYTIDAADINSSSCKFELLSSETYYYYEVCATDKKGNGPTCKQGNFKTTKFDNPNIILNSEPSTAVDGYVKKVNVTFNHSSGTDFYIKSSSDATLDKDTIKNCGTGIEPGTCTTETIKNIISNTWYKVDKNTNIVYDKTNTTISNLDVYVTDGKNIGTASATIYKIDAKEPINVDFTYTKSSGDITVTAVGIDNESGISGYKFSSDNGNTWTDLKTSSTYTFSLPTGLYDVKVRVYDKLSNYMDSDSQNVELKVTYLGISYLDPTNLSNKCSSENSISTPGTKTGCMKWYLYKDNGDGTYQAVLDHNTSNNITWNLSEQTLSNDTGYWDGSLNPRLITEQEIRDITGNTETGWYYFDDSSSYVWLLESSSLSVGFWTSTSISSSKAWAVYNYALGDQSRSSTNFGIRPVITVAK